MKKIKLFLYCLIIWFIISYLFIVYVKIEINPFLWSETLRALSLPFILIFTIISYNILDNYVNKDVVEIERKILDNVTKNLDEEELKVSRLKKELSDSYNENRRLNERIMVLEERVNDLLKASNY